MNGLYLDVRMKALGLNCWQLEQLLATRYGVKVKPRRLIDGRRPSLDTLTALALALKCELSDLWDHRRGESRVRKERGAE